MAYPNFNNGMLNPYMNMNNTYNVQQNPIDGFVKVAGREGAKAYTLPSSSRMPLFDANEDIFYLKTTDASGYPYPLRYFKFNEFFPEEERKSKEAEIENKYVTKDDFNKLEEKINSLLEELNG